MNDRLEGALSALLFSEAWALGWRPGARLVMGGLGRLALRRVRVGLKDDLDPLPQELVPAIIVAPLWLGSPVQEVNEPEPVPSFLRILVRVRSWQRSEPGDPAVSLATHLLRTPEPRPAPLVASAKLLHVLAPRPVTDAARALRNLDRLLSRHHRLKAVSQTDVYRDLVLALLACEAAAFNLTASLQLLYAARGMVACPVAGLLCEARCPRSVPPSWLRDLDGALVAALDAACRNKDAAPV